jgi:O-antigen/teichoic acid export membrane protein
MVDLTLLAVAWVCQSEEVALYGAAYRIWGVFGLPQNAVAISIQGRIAELHAVNDQPGLQALITNSANLAMWPTLLVTLVVCVGAGPILGLLFGEFYAAGHHVLVMLCLAQFLFVILGPGEHLMAMTGKQSIVLYASFASTALAVLMAWTLTPPLGLVGAAAAAGSAIVTFRLLLAWVAWRELGICTWVGRRHRLDKAGPPTCGAAAMNGE